MAAKDYSVRLVLVVVLGTLLSACAIARAEQPPKLALLAPFEGRYREIGYNALYAARMAVNDAKFTGVELLPIDDGGTDQSAADGARALASDPAVGAVLSLGFVAASDPVQANYGDLPVVIVGNWTSERIGHRVLVLSSQEIANYITVEPTLEVTEAAQIEAPIVAGEIFGLAQFPLLRTDLDGVSVVSSGNLPDADFVSRYAASDPFAPHPNHLATLVYDATMMTIEAMTGQDSRDGIFQALTTSSYSGLNGEIRFEDGYWAEAPIHIYSYDADGNLILTDNIVK